MAPAMNLQAVGGCSAAYQNLRTSVTVRITLIANPRDPDRVVQVREQVKILRSAGHEVSPLLTFEQGDGEWMTRRAAEDGADLIIAAGGDGTLNEVANGIVRFVDEGGQSVPRLAIVPFGTANDLAATLGIPDEIEAAIQIAVGEMVMEVDTGMVDGRVFLNVSTGGIGAEATEETSSESKRSLGTLSYMVTGVRKFVALTVCTARFTCGEDEIYDGPFLLFAIGNSIRTGGGNLLTPRASMHDGLLDLCIVKESSRIEFLRLLPELRSGQHLDHPSVIYRQLPGVRVESPVELSVNADGEPLEGRTFRYGIGTHRLKLMVP